MRITTPLILAGLVLVLSTTIGLNSAYAHTRVETGNLEIEVGWTREPPTVGATNQIIVNIAKMGEEKGAKGEPVTGAEKSITLTVKYGGVMKDLELEPDPDQPGTYTASIVPTRIGKYPVVLKGNLLGNSIDKEVEIEDVEDIGKFAFPDSSAQSAELKNVSGQIQSVSSQISQLQDKVNSAQADASSAKQNTGNASTMGVVGTALGAAGIAVAAVSMSRKRRI